MRGGEGKGLEARRKSVGRSSMAQREKWGEKGTKHDKQIHEIDP